MLQTVHLAKLCCIFVYLSDFSISCSHFKKHAYVPYSVLNNKNKKTCNYYKRLI